MEPHSSVPTCAAKRKRGRSVIDAFAQAGRRCGQKRPGPKARALKPLRRAWSARFASWGRMVSVQFGCIGASGLSRNRPSDGVPPGAETNATKRRHSSRLRMAQTSAGACPYSATICACRRTPLSPFGDAPQRGGRCALRQCVGLQKKAALGAISSARARRVETGDRYPRR